MGHRHIIAGFIMVSLIFPSVGNAFNNPSNGSCYTSTGAQYYFRSYSGKKMLGEVGICDEYSTTYKWRSTVGDYTYFYSDYAINWVKKEQGRNRNVAICLVNKQQGKAYILGWINRL